MYQEISNCSAIPTTTDLEFRTDDTTLNSQDYSTAKIESGLLQQLGYCIS